MFSLSPTSNSKSPTSSSSTSNSTTTHTNNNLAQARTVCGQLQKTGDISKYLPQVIKLMAHTELSVKRITYCLYAKHSRKDDGLAMLAVNTILMDSRHSSPFVRCLVLNCLLYIENENLTDLSQSIITNALTDTNIYVRRYAVVAQNRLLGVAPSLKTSGDIEKSALGSDPVAASLHLASSGKTDWGNQEETIPNLLAQITHCRATGNHTQVLPMVAPLKAYSPSNTARLLEILNVLDPCLESAQLDVAIAVMDVFLTYTQYADDTLKVDMFGRVSQTCLGLLRSTAALSNYSVLVWMEENLPLLVSSKKYVSQISENSHLLSTLPSDQLYTVRPRLACLRHFLTDANVRLVVDGITAHLRANNSCKESSSLCVRFLAVDLRGPYPDLSVESVCGLMRSGNDVTSLSLLTVIPSYEPYGEAAVEALFSRLVVLWPRLDESDLTKLLTLCCFYAHRSADHLPYLSDMCDYVTGQAERSGVKCLVTVSVRCALLTALVRCFKVEPVEYKALVLQAFSSFRKINSVILQEHVTWCHQWLQRLTLA